MSGGKDGQTLFHTILPATARGATSTTAVDWHLRVKNKKSDENKKILHHSQHAKNQLNPQTFSVDFRVS